MASSFRRLGPDASRQESRGFTLVELLTVIAIMAIIAGFTASIFSPVMKSMQLAQSAQFLGDQISLARQTAFAKNSPVEVRFYQYANPNLGETAGNPSGGKFRAIQIFLVQDVTNAGVTTERVTPQEKVMNLPDSIIMDSGANLSTLLGSALDKSGSWTATDPQISIPQASTTYNCRYFRFYPDGSTSLSAAGALWFMTLHAQTAGDNLSAPPANFATLQVDPYNGHVQTFRP